MIRARCLFLAGFSVLVCMGPGHALQIFSGAGIPESTSGANGMFQGRGMDHLVQQIEGSKEPAKPFWHMPEWMKPKPIPFPKAGGNRTTSRPSGWFKKPKWMESRSEPDWSGEQSGSGGGFFADASENFRRWGEKAGQNMRTTNQNLRSATSNAWENMKAPFQGSGWSRSQNGSGQSPQPPLRSAEGSFGGQRPQRF